MIEYIIHLRGRITNFKVLNNFPIELESFGAWNYVLAIFGTNIWACVFPKRIKKKAKYLLGPKLLNVIYDLKDHAPQLHDIFSHKVIFEFHIQFGIADDSADLYFRSLGSQYSQTMHFKWHELLFELSRTWGPFKFKSPSKSHINHAMHDIKLVFNRVKAKFLKTSIWQGWPPVQQIMT